MLIQVGDFSLRAHYVPKARYDELADIIEYVRSDKPYIMRRVDSFLTVALDFETRMPAGFRLKGVKNFFLKYLQPKHNLLDEQFLAVVSIIEIAATKAGIEAFGDIAEQRAAYISAYGIALDDRVTMERLPIAA